MTTTLTDKTSSIIRGGDNVARSYDPSGTFRSQVGIEKVTLYPTINTVVGSNTQTQFAFPFAMGECISVGDIKVFAVDKTTELPTYIESLMLWQNWDGNPLRSMRSASITIESTFADNTTPVEIYVQWGLGGSAVTLPEVAFDATWVNYRTSGMQWSNVINVPVGKVPAYDYDGTGYGMPEEVIMEPRTWGVISPEYVKTTGMFDYLLKLNTNDADIANCLAFYQESAATMTNEVGDHVIEGFYTPYFIKTGALGDSVEPAHYASWLFDRAAALWCLYALTGNHKDLVQAHRASYFYESKLVNGSFSLKSTADLKYTYPKSLVFEKLLMGNVNALDQLEEIGAFQDTWDHAYVFTSGSTKLWTERHLAYKLGTYRVLYEVTGSQIYKDKTIELFEQGYNMQQTPQNGWLKDGSIRHTLDVHEGFGGDVAIGSPWMSSLLAGEIKLYYEASHDVRALRMLADLGEWITTYGTRLGAFELTGEVLVDHSVPWYFASDSFASSNATDGQSDHWTDVVHCFDVASLVAKGAWAKQKLGEDYSADLAMAQALIAGGSYKFSNFRRNSAETIADGKTTKRLAPTRSFNWWFTNGYDIAGVMEELTNV